MTTKQLTASELDERVRRTLHAVAATVGPEASTTSRRRHKRSRVIIGVGAIAIAVPLAAAAIIKMGPEYVDDLPPDNVIVTGSIDGHRYWMAEAFHKDACGNTEPGVEIVVEDRNIVGREWDTHGISYGERRPGGCGYDVSNALRHPSLSYSAGSFVGDTFLREYAVHPDVTSLRVTIGDSIQNVKIHALNGAGYAIFEVPAHSRYTVELLIDGNVVPDSKETRTVPSR